MKLSDWFGHRLSFTGSRLSMGGFEPLDRKRFREYNRFRPGGALPIFCYLPFNSMTFSMSGRVYVCSYNKNILLGRYPEQTIEQIWHGEEAVKLREHMRHNDLSYGCGHCKFYFDKGKFTNLRPPSFDRYSEHTVADTPRVLEFELSNECNLECQMCNGNVSSSIRKRRDGLPPLHNPYDDAFLEQLRPYLSNVKEAKFYGGEPFLIPMYFRIWEMIAELNPTCELFVITNGTHWNPRIEALVLNLNMDVAISIDSLQRERLEKIRKNAKMDVLMQNISRFNAILRPKGKHLSLSFTVQQENWQELPDFVRYCNSIEASVYVSYLDSPKEYAIAELPKQELELIHQRLSAENLPKETGLQRHNACCLEDFIAYVQRYIKREDEPQYDDYRPEGSVVHGSVVIVERTATRDELKDALETFLRNNARYRSVNADDLLDKIDDVHDGIDVSYHPMLLGMILQSDKSGTVNALLTRSVEHLSESILKQLPNVRMRHGIN
jgi:radical SAM protein with 4Fe4S-binding SPASM domain